MTENKIDNGTISVVVPIYNSQKFLAMSLQSLLNQTYPYWEAILVNDGSIDNSLQIMEHYAVIDSRFKIINKPNGGVASARNAGLNAVKGEFIVFLDPDDMLYPQFMEIMLKTLLKTKTQIVSCNFEKACENATLDFCKNYKSYKITVGKDLVSLFVYRKRPKVKISCCCRIYRAELLKYHRFCEEFKVMAEDFYYSMTLFPKIAKASFVKLKLMAYRQNSNSLTHRQISFDICDDHLLLLRKLADFYSDYKNKRVFKKLLRRLSKITYEYCCIAPYVDKEVDYFDFWRRYFPKLVMLKDENIFDEKGLTFLSRQCFKKFYSGDIDEYETALSRYIKLRNRFKFL